MVSDISLFIGNVIIERAAGLQRAMFDKGTRDISYQHPVIMGFTNVPNPKYNIDVDGVVATSGHAVVGGRILVDPQGFVKLVHAAVEHA